MVPGGRWWRYDRYELQGGSICPARGAKLREYNPWADYEAAARQSQAAPYHSLLSLLERFDEAGLLKWCAEHGLIGVLPHRALMVTFVARLQHQRGRRVVGFTQVRYVRSHSAWTGFRRFVPLSVDPYRLPFSPGVLLQ